MSVKVIVDSGSDIEEKEAKKMGLILVPLQINFGEESYQGGVDISNEEFFNKLEASTDNPKTSQINPFVFEEIFQKVVDDGDEAVVILISSKLSGTYQNGVSAAEKFGDKICVVDSLNISIGQRMLCKVALQLVKEGKSAKEIAEVLESLKGKIKYHAMLDTLKYLKRGGRISALIATVGELITIKPIVSVIGGEIKLVGKAIGQKLAFKRLNQYLREQNIDYTKPYCFAFAGKNDQIMARYIENNEDVKAKIPNAPIHSVGAVIGTYTGPNAIGYAFFEKDSEEKEHDKKDEK